jgi:hypothetical protein
MNEIEVPLKITGVTEIRKQLKDLKSEYINATDPARMAEIADQAGNLQKKLDGATKAFAGFTEGTNLEQTQNAFTNLKDSIINLDFAKAGKQASVFNQTLKALKPEDFMGQINGLGKTFLGLGKTIGIVSKQFIAFGLSLLANPIFLLVAVIVAVVAVFLLWLNKIGVLKKAIDFLMKPINDLIAGFKELTDWLGLTSYAAEENAAKMIEANDKIMESSKDRQDTIVSGFDYEIRMAKIYGQETLDLELNKSKVIGSEAKKRLSSNQKALDAQLALGDKANKEEVKKLKTAIKEQSTVITDQRRERNAIVAQDRVDKQADAKKELEEDKKNNKERHKAAIDAAKAAAAAAKKFAEDRLNAQRTIRDIEISLIQKDADREIVATQEKYARLQEDLIKNENYTTEEKLRLKVLYQKQLEDELGKQEQIEIDAEKAKQKALLEEYNSGLIKQYELQDKQALQLQELLAKTEDEKFELIKTKRALQFEAEIAASGENQELIKALTIQYQDELTAMDKKRAEDKVKLAADTEAKIRAENLQTAKEALQTAQAGIDGIQALSDINFNAKMSKLKKGSKEEEAYAKKQFQVNKALQLSTAVINGAQSILAITSVPDFTLGVATAVRIASQVAITAGTIAKIASTQFTSTGGGGGGGGGGVPAASSTSTTAAAPTFNLFGQGNNDNNVGAPQDSQTSITVNAVVSETELTNTQNKVAKINKNATL